MIGSPMHVRAAHMGDIDALMDFVDKVVYARDPSLLRDREKNVALVEMLLARAANVDHPCAFVAVAEDSVGLRGLLAMTRSSEGEATVDVLLTEPTVWGSFAGQRLMTLMWERVKDAGCEKILAWIPNTAQRARGTFQREGFQRVDGVWRDSEDPKGPRMQLYTVDVASCSPLHNHG